MELKKNAFSYFVIALFLIGDLYILIGGISTLGAGTSYPYASQGLMLVIFLGVWLLVNLIAYIMCKLTIEDHIKEHKKAFLIVEIVMIALVIIAGFVVREIYVANFPMEPSSDFKTYYEVADMIRRGTLTSEGQGYCDYISVFPHVYGYPDILAKLFAIFGTSVNTAQQFNIVLSMLSVGLVYVIGRLSMSRGSAFIAMCLACFWPSQITYLNMVASEYLFSALMLACIALFLATLKFYGEKAKHPIIGLLLNILLGILLAVDAFVRPMAMILLIAIILCIIFSSFRLPVRKIVDQPISLVILSKGWLRCIVIILPYILVSNLLTFGVEYNIERKVAGGSSSMGYNLLVGVNAASVGGWNQEDSDFLYAALESTGNASLAQRECLNAAIERIKENPERLFNLFFKKYEALWANDDFGCTWSIEFMNEQGNLTEARRDFLVTTREINNAMYLVIVALAGVMGIFIWKKGIKNSYLFIMIFLGTVAMHLLVETQNRYHYHALFLMFLLAAEALGEVYEFNRERVLAGRVEKEKLAEAKLADAKKREDIELEEEKLKNIRTEAMQCHFDMKYALEHNLIKVSVSDSYRVENGLNLDEVSIVGEQSAHEEQ